jgi:hypothetical protein
MLVYLSKVGIAFAFLEMIENLLFVKWNNRWNNKFLNVM